MSLYLSLFLFLSVSLSVSLQVFGALTIAACSYALIVLSHSVAIRIPCILGIVLGALLFGSTIFGCIAALRESIRLSWIVSWNNITEAYCALGS